MFNNKKSRKALPVIITALAVITILFNNKINIYAAETETEQTSIDSAVDSKASTMRYSPVMYWVATDGEGSGYTLTGNNQTLVYDNGDYICVNGNFLWRKESTDDKFSFENDMVINEAGQLYFTNTGVVYVGFNSYDYDITNTYYIADSLEESEALDLVDQNLGTASIQNQYNIQDLYVSTDFGQDKNITDYAVHDLENGTVQFLASSDNVGCYIDYLKIYGSDYSKPYFYREYFYSTDGQTYTYTQLENLISDNNCAGEEDDILLLGVGNFTYAGSLLSDGEVASLENCTVNSWSYKSFVYTKYNTKEAFLNEPSSNNSNLKIENSNVINAETDPGVIDDESEQIRNDNFWEFVINSLNNSLLGQLVSSISEFINTFINSIQEIGVIFSAVLGWLPQEIQTIIIGVFMLVIGFAVVRAVMALIMKIGG